MAFKPKQTYTGNDQREQQSVDFINGLLKGTHAYPELKYGEKGANIDGYIHLLDEERCIDGKMTVQVKTVSPCNEEKNVFPCPTSLFGYAERTNDDVFLLAVDHLQQVVLWKYISRQLIKANQHKQDQETITLHFNDNEKLTKDNIQETINKWKSICNFHKKLIDNIENINEENEKLRHLLVFAESSAFTIPKTEVIEIQKFSDIYNGLLDTDFNYVKRTRYPYIWKQGIAIFDYQDDEVLYAIYSIKYGENSLLIKQLPQNTLNKFNFVIAYHGFNKIKNDIFSLVTERLTDDITQMFKRYKTIPPYDYYVVEYLQDVINTYSNTLCNSTQIAHDYYALQKEIEQHIKKHRKILKGGYKPVDLEVVDDCINYLLNRGYKGNIELYPSENEYGYTGYATDSYTPELAFAKMQIVLNYVYETYTNFINNNFYSIKDGLDMYFNADFVLINLEYDKKYPNIPAYYFYRNDNNYKKEKTKVEFCLQKQHELFDKYATSNFFENAISYKGHTYQCKRAWGFSAFDVIIGRTCLIDTFYKVFKTRLEQYVKDMQIHI
ncbi:MAG: hypothetical protein K6F33_11705 [Bacteroidales bacterium]|nr:hypothetical protein [Bacteroidales bacterium]